MRKIGSFLKEERTNKKLSLFQMERETKIKKEFIDLIEKGDWKDLPEYPVTLGFVRTIAKSLGIPEDKAMALLRRDYPFDKNKLSINPKPDLKLKESISPRIVTVFLSVFAVLCILGYLVYQYFLYISPPKLIVVQPTENQEVIGNEVRVFGKTDTDATLMVNNQQVLVSDTGEFSDRIGVGENTKDLVFVARSRYGKETVIIRKIVTTQK
jgi:cytoskeletal protein RodZ